MSMPQGDQQDWIPRDSFQAASRKLKKSLETSNIVTTEGDYGRGKRKTIKRKRWLLLSSESEEEYNVANPPLYVPTLEAMPGQVTCEDNPTLHTEELLQNQPETQIPKTPVLPSSGNQMPGIVKCELRSGDSEEELENFSEHFFCKTSSQLCKLTALAGQTLSRNSEPSNGLKRDDRKLAHASKQGLTEFEQRMITSIELLNVKMDHLQEGVDLIIQKMKLQEVANSTCISTNIKDIVELFPLSSEVDIETVEKELLKEEIFEEMKHYLKGIGGDNADHIIRSILRRVITDVSALQFSYLGRRGKKSFKQLNICKVIYAAVRSQPKGKDVQEREIDKCIESWLRHAKARAKDKNL